MLKYYIVYAKTKDMKRFKPVDLNSGLIVTNLIHATMVPVGLDLSFLKELNPEIEFKLKRIK